MNVVVDTTAWSLLLRRQSPINHPVVVELTRLIHHDAAVMLGPVRQELLSGVRIEIQFERLRRRLRDYPGLEIEDVHYELAAAFYNICRSSGIQGSQVDLLICAVASNLGMPILSTDRDFESYATVLPIDLHVP